MTSDPTPNQADLREQVHDLAQLGHPRAQSSENVAADVFLSRSARSP
ncbi:hypothetical protein [Streptomyces sp. NPDC056194]